MTANCASIWTNRVLSFLTRIDLRRLASAALLGFGLMVWIGAPAGAVERFASLEPRDAAREARPIEIGDDSGGYVSDYAVRLYDMEATKQQVKFVGRCDSACTLFLALPPDETCISEGTYFRFHAPSAPSASAAMKVEAYMMRKYPRWVRVWIVAQGGLSDALTTMGYDYARKFMRACR